MTAHAITVDQDASADSKDLGQPMFKAFCNGDSCTWSADTWHHADEFPGYADPVGAAENAASEDGQQHLIDEGRDPALMAATAKVK